MNGPPKAFRHLGLTLLAWIGGRFLFATMIDQPQAHTNGSLRMAEQAAHSHTGQKHDTTAPVLASGFGSVQPPKINTPRRMASIRGAYMARVPEARPIPSAGLVAGASIEEHAERTTGESRHRGPIRARLAAARKPSAENDWSLSGWAIYRPDTGSVSLSPVGQLGGSQLGVRVQRKLLETADKTILSLNVRASAPLRVSNGKEAGVGLAIRRPGRIPVELIAERRIGLDRGGRNAFAGLIATGIDDLPVLAGFTLSGYAQAGLVGIRARDGFADGSLRLERHIAAKDSLTVAIGGGAWGAVQPGVSRIDVGPSIAARFRIGKAGVRLAGEWRQRVVGEARPGSGPAITFGLDY